MKIAMITDLHFGARGDSINFLDFYDKFYEKVFFPYIKANNIRHLIILGDTFDRRKFINFLSLSRAKDMFFERLALHEIKVYMIIGNHDTFYKNTNEINSPELLLQEYDNIAYISNPRTIRIEKTPICVIPWMCEDNSEDALKEMSTTDATICMGHFEIEGFAMHRGMLGEKGLNRDIFRNFTHTFSGHYHTKSHHGGIHYLGNPYQLTWEDYGDTRGFHIFDLLSKELDFIENPYIMFHKVVYDDVDQSVSEISNQDLSMYEGTYVKLIVVNKTNPYLFDTFYNNLEKANPIDIETVEDAMDLTEGVDDDIIDQSKSTLEIINEYVDHINQENLEPSKLKSIIRETYIEALNFE